eukprot:scaffold31941_cov63-Phaeocystis_antarctica.AAC.2
MQQQRHGRRRGRRGAAALHVVHIDALDLGEARALDSRLRGGAQRPRLLLDPAAEAEGPEQ